MNHHIPQAGERLSVYEAWKSSLSFLLNLPSLLIDTPADGSMDLKVQ